MKKGWRKPSKAQDVYQKKVYNATAEYVLFTTNHEAKIVEPEVVVEKVEVKVEEKFYHTVKYSGETLGLIAKWYTTSPANWKRIAQHNPGLIPNKIKKNQKIYIPKKVLVNHMKMPKRFIKENYKKRKKVIKKLKNDMVVLDEVKKEKDTLPDGFFIE